jgi:hypothetical protein
MTRRYLVGAALLLAAGILAGWLTTPSAAAANGGISIAEKVTSLGPVESDAVLAGGAHMSPDGKHVAYAAELGGKSFAVVDGVESPAYQRASAPVFSPDSKHFAYTVVRDGRHIFAVDGVEGKECDCLSDTVFSPDSERVVYTAGRRGKKWFIVAAGTESKECDYVGSPVFSSDGKRVAYTAQRGEKWFAVDELLEDLRRGAKAIGRDTITKAEYRDIGKGSPTTIERRSGSWTKALRLAGLQLSKYGKRGITDEELPRNIKSLWICLGRQPRYDEAKAPNPQFSTRPYEDRFGSWPKALRASVVWGNSDSPDELEQAEATERGTADPAVRRASSKRRTRRGISERQGYRILVRDGSRCKACGASPPEKRGIELRVDHILPWSRGGETTDDNLETKCKRCNLGKGNAFDA